MLNRDENKENNVNLINVHTIFGNLLNNKSDKNPINLNIKIKKEYNEVINLLKKEIKPKIKKRKPSPLKRFEKLIAEYFFGKNGKFTHLIPNLKTELIEKERKREYELKEKISLGELTFLQNKSYDNCIFEREKEIKKYNLLKSTNFKKEKNYLNYEQIRIKSKRHKKLMSQFSPECYIYCSELDMKNKNKNYSEINKKKVNNFIMTTFHKLNPKTESIKQKKRYIHKGKNEIRNNSILENINFSSPKLLNESNNTFITLSKLKNDNKKINSSKNENKKNQNQINTVTTSVNSGSNNSSNNNNAISTFKISKSSIKTSNFSTSQNIINNVENNMSNSLYIKNAIANINLDNLQKTNKKNQIALLKVSNSEKQLLLPEYSVEKSFILNSYLNFNQKNNIKDLNFDFSKINKEKSYNKRIDNSLSINRKSFNKKDFYYKLDNIISNGKQFSKSLQKITKNQSNTKLQDFLEKRKNKSLIQGDINKIKSILEDNNTIKKDKFIKSVNTERIENDNKLIDITKKIKDNEILSILLNAKKGKMQNLQFIKHNNNFGNWSQKFHKNNSEIINHLSTIIIQEKNKLFNRNLNKK